MTRYAQVETDLPSGAAVLLYTDGLSETRNANGDMLGEEKLLAMFAQAITQTSDAPAGKEFLLGCLDDYSNHQPLMDDHTLILIRHLA